MVKADLSYNPYLNETIIRFNGKKPRINSLVEKYEDKLLYEWIDKLPQIFHDEMNGYGFELDFSGTRLDYEELTKAFHNAGVTEDMVQIFHKNELDGRRKKVDEILSLLKWLEEHPNRQFDYHQFYQDHEALIEDDYIYIFLHGDDIDVNNLADFDISVEKVGDSEELNNTSLKNTPILFCLNKDVLPRFQKDLKYFFSREDVTNEQLFFIIHPDLDYEKAERLIKDLGIKYPNMVNDPIDPKVMKYFELSPITDFIYNSIVVFREKYEQISRTLKEENEKSNIENREVLAQIDKYEEIVQRLNNTLNSFVHRDNLEMLDQYNEEKKNLLNTINEWQKRRTKITNSEDVEVFGRDLDSLLHKQYLAFITKVSEITEQESERITSMWQSLYKEANFDTSYTISVPYTVSIAHEPLPSILVDLADLKEEKWVMPKGDLLGRIFRSSEDFLEEPVLEVTYNFQKWRDYAVHIIKPFSEKYIQMLFENLKKYYETAAEAYIKHLEQLITDQTQKKEVAAMQLSEEQQRLQADNDWLAEFSNRLVRIERE